MQPIHTLTIFLASVPADLQELVFEIRNLVAEVAPQAVEDLRRTGISYYHQGGGPVSAAICGITFHPGCLHLDFNHGAFLPDPCRLLADSGGRKSKRYLALDSFDAVPWEAVRDLIHASAQYDPYLPQEARP